MIENIKYNLKKILPAKIFFFFFNIWYMLGVQNFIHSIKRKKFKLPLIKKLTYKKVSFLIKIYPRSLNLNVFQDDFIYLKNSHPEPEILDIFIKYINKGDFVLDIGANIGHHSLFMSKLVGDFGKVLSFEPIHEMVCRIKENIEINNIKNIEINNFGLGLKEEVKKFYIYTKDVGSSSLIKKEDSIESLISIKTLDSLNMDRVDFIKIDVEGYEYNVLLGAEKTIQKLNPIIVLEYSPIFYKKYDKTHSKKIIDFLLEKKYNIYLVDNKYRRIKDYLELESILKKTKIDLTNLLCIPIK